MPTKAPASDPPFCDIFVPQKILRFEIFDDVFACDLQFGPPLIKNSGDAYAPRQCFFLILITIDLKTIIPSRI